MALQLNEAASWLVSQGYLSDHADLLERGNDFQVSADSRCNRTAPVPGRKTMSAVNSSTTEGDLCRYAVDKSYLRERLDLLLKAQLIDKPLSPDEHEPSIPGNCHMGDQRFPIALVSRLCQPKHTDKMDIELRQSNLGLTIFLTTSM
jgi:hypothetical protein